MFGHVILGGWESYLFDWFD